MRLLVVDEDPRVRRVTGPGSARTAYAVDVAVDGHAALLHARDTDYDAIVLDVMLPVVDGLLVCTAIRAAGSQVPILMLTARDGIDARIAGRRSGADDYLMKPSPSRNCWRASVRSSDGGTNRRCPSA